MAASREWGGGGERAGNKSFLASNNPFLSFTPKCTLCVIRTTHLRQEVREGKDAVRVKLQSRSPESFFLLSREFSVGGSERYTEFSKAFL